MITCTKCKEAKEFTAFNKETRRKTGFRAWCKICDRTSGDAWFAKHPGFRRAYNCKPENRFRKGQHSSKRRNIIWTITFEEWWNLVNTNMCHYCEDVLPATSYALDRKDNTLGYVFNNVVPCCGPCNEIKGKNLTYEEMLLVSKYIKQIRSK